MNILHYTLGLPPYRTGGLTKYSLDIMISEQKLGNEISLLYPGRFDFTKKIKIKRNSRDYNINIYEIINPLPVPLLGGIRNYEKFTKLVDKKIYENFLKNIKPDIIHVHTLMGLHKEFFQVAKELDIKIIYTTHDYFGICPKVNLIDFNGQVCTDYNYGKKCEICNENSYSIKMIYLMQSKIYRNIKDSKLVKKLRNYKKNQIININDENKASVNCEPMDSDNNKDYIKLRKYYTDILYLINYVHFNSTIAQNEYKKYIPNINGEVVSITHSNIKNNNIEKVFSPDDEKLKISYLGPIDKYKGFYLLKDSLENLLNKGIINWKLSIYGDNKSLNLDNKYYESHGRYSYDELEGILKNTDVLVIPSIWKETFGFIGLEALSYGVPVIISDYVGLKDIVERYKVGITFNPNINELSEVISKIVNDRSILYDISKNIIEQNIDFTMKKHTLSIIDLYNRVILERI